MPFAVLNAAVSSLMTLMMGKRTMIERHELKFAFGDLSVVSMSQLEEDFAVSSQGESQEIGRTRLCTNHPKWTLIADVGVRHEAAFKETCEFLPTIPEGWGESTEDLPALPFPVLWAHHDSTHPTLTVVSCGSEFDCDITSPWGLTTHSLAAASEVLEASPTDGANDAAGELALGSVLGDGHALLRTQLLPTGGAWHGDEEASVTTRKLRLDVGLFFAASQQPSQLLTGAEDPWPALCDALLDAFPSVPAAAAATAAAATPAVPIVVTSGMGDVIAWPGHWARGGGSGRDGTPVSTLATHRLPYALDMCRGERSWAEARLWPQTHLATDGPPSTTGFANR